MSGRTDEPIGDAPISDDFVIALRAEAPTGDEQPVCRLRCRWSPWRPTSANSSCSIRIPPRRPVATLGLAAASTGRCGISAFGGITPNLPAL